MNEREQWLDLTVRLKREAQRLGFGMAGVVRAVPGRRLGAYLRWLEAQMHGEMAYMARPDRVVRRQDLGQILAGVQTMVCVGLDYHSGALPPEITADPSRGRVASYAWGVDYHEVMTPRLVALGQWLGEEAAVLGWREAIQHKVYVDTGAILERDHAEQAGLGFTGKNTMLIAPRRGSWLFLGELLTTLPLVAEEEEAQVGEMPSCGRCTRCLTACPTNAFPTPYVLDARRCISYLTIELKGSIPEELRPLVGNWIYGCDVCQEVCPFNRFAEETAEENFRAPSWETAAPPLLALLRLSRAEFATRYAGSPIQRIKWARFMRNVCVAAGNWGDEAAVPALQTLAQDESELVREHAGWALAQIGKKKPWRS